VRKRCATTAVASVSVPSERHRGDATDGIFEVGGYPYFNVVGDRCSVWQNRGVEEENA
jgi:hypothetical protein